MEVKWELWSIQNTFSSQHSAKSQSTQILSLSYKNKNVSLSFSLCVPALSSIKKNRGPLGLSLIISVVFAVWKPVSSPSAVSSDLCCQTQCWANTQRRESKHGYWVSGTYWDTARQADTQCKYTRSLKHSHTHKGSQYKLSKGHIFLHTHTHIQIHMLKND